MPYDVIIAKPDGTVVDSDAFLNLKKAKEWAAGKSGCIIYIYKDEQLYQKYYGRKKRKMQSKW